jgi:hypothetical protein
MKLLTFFNENDKVVYGTTTGGKLYFFYKGFASAEEARGETIKLHARFYREKSPNISLSLARALVEPALDGEWTEIE